jgi:CRISPR-associated protein Csd1
MILHALKDYYDRVSVSGPDLPLFGFARQKVPFCLLINEDGTPANPPVIDLRDHEGKSPRRRELIVPQPIKRSGTGYAPNFLWDNTGYVLGADTKGDPKRAAQSHESFKNFHSKMGENISDKGMKAVLGFLGKWNPVNASSLPYWEELAGQNVVFRLTEDQCYVHEREIPRAAWLRQCSEKEAKVEGMCLVTGQVGPVARLHPDIKGVFGAQAKGAALVSFNLDAFKSYAKDQNFNAPVGEEAAFAYTTALNWLLRDGSDQKIRIGDTSIVFWTEKRTMAESLLSAILNLNMRDEGEVSQDRTPTTRLRAILEAARDGRIQDAVEEPDVPFYILGLAPNASRLSVRFWHVSTVGKIVENVGKHLREIAIAKSYPGEPEYPPLWQIVRETAPQGKSENISPLLAGGIVRAVLSGWNYPANLLPAILMRIRADHNVNRLRAGLIKAFLMRNSQLTEVDVSLDKFNKDTGYLLGRLFAILERAQDRANPAISSTIRDKYFGSAAATPQNVFPILFRLGQQHLGKLRRDNEKKRFAGWLDRLIEEIVHILPAQNFPAFLDSRSQGLFVIGYYHQRQDFFSGKTDSDKIEEGEE